MAARRPSGGEAAARRLGTSEQAGPKPQAVIRLLSKASGQGPGHGWRVQRLCGGLGARAKATAAAPSSQARASSGYAARAVGWLGPVRRATRSGGRVQVCDPARDCARWICATLVKRLGKILELLSFGSLEN